MTTQPQPQSRRPTLSIVIPAYNEEGSLPNTLQSLEKQLAEDIEVIVADNNSKDSTAKIAREFGARVITVSQQGYVFALNEGMKEAQGDIIAVTDADTLVFPDWVSVIRTSFEDKDVIAITGSCRVKSLFPFNYLMDLLFSLFLWVHFLIGKAHLIGFNFAIRKDVFHKVGGLDTHFAMSPDVDLGIRLKGKGKLLFKESLRVVPSNRRWEENAVKAFWEYSKGYIYAVWLRRPPRVVQSIIRE